MRYILPNASSSARAHVWRARVQHRGGWKEVVKAHVQALISPNFAKSANLSSLTQQFCISFDDNEIDISGAQNGVMWSVGRLSSVVEERAFVDVS